MNTITHYLTRQPVNDIYYLVSNETCHLGQWVKSIRYDEPKKFAEFENCYMVECKPIIASTIKIEGIPQLQLEQVNEILEIEDVSNYNHPIHALNAAITILEKDGWHKSDCMVHLLMVKEYIESHKTATKEKLFTLEDINKAINHGRGQIIYSIGIGTIEENTEQFIQSLTKNDLVEVAVINQEDGFLNIKAIK